MIRLYFKVTVQQSREVMPQHLLFYYGKTIEYFTPVFRNEYRSYQPMSLLIYQAMVDGAKAGYERWNWGGTWENQEGVYRFKSKMEFPGS